MVLRNKFSKKNIICFLHLHWKLLPYWHNHWKLINLTVFWIKDTTMTNSQVMNFLFWLKHFIFIILYWAAYCMWNCYSDLFNCLLYLLLFLKKKRLLNIQMVYEELWWIFIIFFLFFLIVMVSRSSCLEISTRVWSTIKKRK